MQEGPSQDINFSMKRGRVRKEGNHYGRKGAMLLEVVASVSLENGIGVVTSARWAGGDGTREWQKEKMGCRGRGADGSGREAGGGRDGAGAAA